MRLICPNCGAQYEVSDDVIPETGRDVQCSNCGQTWFQNRAEPDPELQEADDIEIVEPEDWGRPPEEDYDDEAAHSDQDTSFDDASDGVWIDDDVIASGSGDAQTPNEFETTTTPTVPPHREMDPEVASILREEADLETQARAADTSSLETQGDLGLIEADPAVTKREAEIRERMADIQGLPHADPDGPRRELLPDIEEINSSLSDRTPEATASEADIDYAVQNRRGFRFGFTLVAGIVLFTILVYAYGPQIVEKIPQAGGMISELTTYVDKSRIWFDEIVQRFIVKVSAI